MTSLFLVAVGAQLIDDEDMFDQPSENILELFEDPVDSGPIDIEDFEELGPRATSSSKHVGIFHGRSHGGFGSGGYGVYGLGGYRSYGYGPSYSSGYGYGGLNRVYGGYPYGYGGNHRYGYRPKGASYGYNHGYGYSGFGKLYRGYAYGRGY